MLQIQGSVQILPQSVAVDSGEVTIQGKTDTAVILRMISEVGEIRVILPKDNAEAIAKSMIQLAGAKLQVATDIKEAEKWVGPKSSNNG
jgi:hypothetical protein